MSHIYEERLERDLNRIRDCVAEVSHKVEQALKDALQTVFHRDHRLANAIMLGDKPINRAIREIDRLCHFFVARHLPTAGHLRFISSVLRLSIALERIGDYAVTIAREGRMLSQPLRDDVRREVERMAEESFHMFHQAMDAFNERNADAARAIKGLAYQVDHTLADVFDMLVRKGEEDKLSVKDLFAVFIIFNRLERVSDQAKNICEETIFAVTGEMKKPKVYRILFLDEKDDYRTQMAVAIARKAYPEQGAYSSAGLAASDQVDPACLHLMAERGHALNGNPPRRVEDLTEDWKDHHVVVSLSGPIERYIQDLPFHLITLEWKLPDPLRGTPDDEKTREVFESIYRELAANIGDLVEVLHGEEVT